MKILINRLFLFRRKTKKNVPAKLTQRESEILRFILNDLSYSEIGSKLGIKQSTVSKHASNIFKKYNCSDRETLEQIHAQTPIDLKKSN